MERSISLHMFQLMSWQHVMHVPHFSQRSRAVCCNACDACDSLNVPYQNSPPSFAPQNTAVHFQMSLVKEEAQECLHSILVQLT